MNTSRPCIFLGPSLAIDEAREVLDAVYLPPVKYGDVYRVTELFEPAVIGIIDGYFNQVPAVWHKEILWAMDKGITVYGAASMGALRAAELDVLEMHGIGTIYRAYKTGILEPYTDECFDADDEVAVLHAPAEMGYRPMSESLVNMRLTLAAACADNIISAASRDQLASHIKQLFYPRRSYTTLLEQAKTMLEKAEYQRFEHWLANGTVDQKRADALELLEQVNALQPPLESATKPATFHHTAQWDDALYEIEQSHCFAHPALDELRLLGDEWFEQVEQAMGVPFDPVQAVGVQLNPSEQTVDVPSTPLDELRSLGDEWFEQVEQAMGVPFDPVQAVGVQLNPSEQTVDVPSTPPEQKVGVQFGLFHRSPEALHEAFSRIWQQRDAGNTGELPSRSRIYMRVVELLRQSGELEALVARAVDKREVLGQVDMLPVADDLNELELLDLSDWYFGQRLGRELPTDLEGYALDLGLEDVNDFYAMIFKEYLYLEQQ